MKNELDYIFNPRSIAVIGVSDTFRRERRSWVYPPTPALPRCRAILILPF